MFDDKKSQGYLCDKKEYFINNKPGKHTNRGVLFYLFFSSTNLTSFILGVMSFMKKYFPWKATFLGTLVLKSTI